MLDKTKRDNRVKVLRGKLQKVALNLTENVKYNMTNFMKRPEAQKTRFEKELWGDMLATNSKDKMQLLTNLEATRDDKILERDEDGDIVDSLGDTRGTALVHSFSEDKPHGIVSPIDKQEQEYQQTKLLMKQTADGKPPRMTQERATRTLDDIEKGNARKSRRPVDSTYKFKVSKLQARLQKIAAKGDIVPTKYYGGNPDTTIKMKPKEYLDKTSSTGLQESIAENRKIEHNSGVISDLNNTHSGNPADNNYVRENTKKKKYYIYQDKDGNYTKDFHKYYKMKDTVGVNELDFIDENTEPTTYEGKTPTGWRGHDTRNKILGTGEDTTGFDRTGEEIFRGDEAGSTEYFKRKLRRGDSIERPFLSVNDKNKVTSHEGRHRSRAMMEEGVTEEEVNVMGDMSKDYYGIKDIISGQQNSLDEVKRQSDLAERIRRTIPFEFNKRMKGRESESVRISPQTLKEKLDKIKEDTRAPIFGRYSKLKGKLQKIATDINRSPVDNNMSKSDEIINSFQNSGLSIEGVDGVYDTENHKILDAFNSDDVERLRELYGKDKYIGTNSETDTRDGPNTNDLERTRKELQFIEDAGGIPALGFDSTEGGSFEALNISVVNSKEEVLQALNKNQWGTGILYPTGKFEVVKSPKYTGRNK